uniref:Fe2OG dioxygenase domain-containing protein n=1 Tax=Brassica oleracea var. oleracea TaxID=109376 RepID=A0A0D3CQI5_BRAOL
MGSETPLLPLHLPVIDFSNQNLKPGEPQWDLTKADVQKALQDYGCFEASFDKVPIELRKSIFKALEELFDLPLKTKLRNVSKKPFHGYVGQYPMVPLYESMGIDDSDVVDKVEAFTEKLWPQGNNSFSATIHSFSKKLSELDITIRRMIMESFGLVKYIDEHLQSTNYLLRVMKYTGPDTEETKLGLNAHTDKNIVTILYQNHVEGLEVQTKDKNWIKVKPSEDSFIVMIGDSLHALLNADETEDELEPAEESMLELKPAEVIVDELDELSEISDTSLELNELSDTEDGAGLVKIFEADQRKLFSQFEAQQFCDNLVESVVKALKDVSKIQKKSTTTRASVAKPSLFINEKPKGKPENNLADQKDFSDSLPIFDEYDEETIESLIICEDECDLPSPKSDFMFDDEETNGLTCFEPEHPSSLVLFSQDFKEEPFDYSHQGLLLGTRRPMDDDL